MQITADASKILKTVQGIITFVLNFLLESGIRFAWFSIVLAKKKLVSFTESDFYQK